MKNGPVLREEQGRFTRRTALFFAKNSAVLTSEICFFKNKSVYLQIEIDIQNLLNK